MNCNFLKKNVFVLLASFAVLSCSNYMGLTIAERQELKIKDTPALTVQQLPTILPCKKVGDHYELEVIVIPEKNLRFPKNGDNYKINFDAFVTNDVAITDLKATMMNMPNMSYYIPLENRIESNNGRITVYEDFEFPKEIPNLRVALKNLRIVAIVESAAEDGVTFTLTKQPVRHVESENVEIEYVSFDAPPAEIGEVVVTLKNADGSVFTSITGKTGERLEIPQQIPVCRGWVFKKWIGVPEIFPQKNLEIEAEWELMDYYIDYELSGGVNSQENPDSYSEKNEAIKLWPATKEGSIFEGWYTDKNFENKIEVIQTNRGEDITLYAKWIEVKIGQIMLNPEKPVIVSGRQGKVVARLVMSDGSTPDVTLTSDDESLAKIDKDGNVTAQEITFVAGNPVKSIREVTFTATYDNLKASCKVKLIPTTLTRSIFQAIEPNYDKITDYAVPEGIKELAKENNYGTFEGRRNLENVSLPDSLTVIGEWAFCGSLTCNVNIPKYIERIEDYAFRNFYGQFADRKIVGERLTYIGKYAFSYSTADFSCEFPQSLSYIGDMAFDNCNNCTGPLSLPDELEYLGKCAFTSCTNLTGSIKIPSTIREIPEQAFYGCSSLDGTISIPDSVTSIGIYAFYNCKNLTGKLPLPNDLKTLGSFAFANCSRLTGSITIPENVTEIPKYAFYRCSSLEGPLEIPASVKEIWYSAFADCSSLEEVIIPGDGSIESIYGSYSWSNMNAFYNSATKVTITGYLPKDEWDTEKWNSKVLYGFQNLKELYVEHLPDAYKNIEGVLYSIGETKLVYVPRHHGGTAIDGLTPYKLPKTVREIGDYAMYGKIGIMSYENWDNIEKIGDYALYSANATIHIVCANVKHIGKGAFENGTYEGETYTLDFSNQKGWYLATSPDATSGISIIVSDGEQNFKNLMNSQGAWTKYYLKRD